MLCFLLRALEEGLWEEKLTHLSYDHTIYGGREISWVQTRCLNLWISTGYLNWELKMFWYQNKNHPQPDKPTI